MLQKATRTPQRCVIQNTGDIGYILDMIWHIDIKAAGSSFSEARQYEIPHAQVLPKAHTDVELK